MLLCTIQRSPRKSTSCDSKHVSIHHVLREYTVHRLVLHSLSWPFMVRYGLSQCRKRRPGRGPHACFPHIFQTKGRHNAELWEQSDHSQAEVSRERSANGAATFISA